VYASALIIKRSSKCIMSSYILSAGRNVKGEEEGKLKNKKKE
jgi:hypothetical protein